MQSLKSAQWIETSMTINVYLSMHKSHHMAINVECLVTNEFSRVVQLLLSLLD